MTLVQAIIYGVVQGLTEFLPISSSAHLVLLPWFMGWEDPGLAFDVGLHWGTLIAVVIYFRWDIFELAKSFFVSLKERKIQGHELPWQIMAATIPGAALGYVFEHQAETLFRSPLLMAGTLSLMAVFLYLSERRGRQETAIEHLPWPHAVAIGVAQGLAIVPGVSRSGITICLALFLGLKRTAAVRFSFYLSIPIIFGAGLLKSEYVLSNLGNPIFAAGLISSALSGMAAIHLLLMHVKTRTFLPFVIYRVLLAVLIVGWFFVKKQ